MGNDPVTVQSHQLQAYLTALFRHAGMPPADADWSAAALVQTNLWGIDSHGVLRAPIYLRRLRSGAINPRPALRSSGHGALARLDGDDGMGYVVGRAAMARAIELAQQFGIGAVAVTRSNHFGAAGLYARQAADAGLIGLALTNAAPNMVAPGGSRPITGNNPLAIAAPTGGPFPFMLDISLSNVAGGKLLLAAEKGETIPLDWATDREGRPTDDPTAAFAGFLLPVGAHKGLGLAYAVDILCGVLAGGAFQHTIRSMYRQSEAPSLTGHFMLAIDTAAFMPPEAFSERMQQFATTIDRSPMWDAEHRMMLPGEPEFRTEQIRRRQGVPLPQSLYDDLVALGDEVGIEAVLT